MERLTSVIAASSRRARAMGLPSPSQRSDHRPIVATSARRIEVPDGVSPGDRRQPGPVPWWLRLLVMVQGRFDDLDPGTGGNRNAYMPDPGTLASQAQRAADVEREASLDLGARLPVVSVVVGVALLVIGLLVIVGSSPGAAAPAFNESAFILGAVLAAGGTWLIATRLSRWRRDRPGRR
jgi:hypothetical protein